MSETTACGLDCYDACCICVEEGKLSGDISHPAGNGALCAVLNKTMHETPRITKPMIDGKEVSLEEALAATAVTLREESSLLWRGSGNVGVMQQVSDLLMDQIGGTLTKGSLCDGSGAAGIEEGRGVNRTLPLEQIEKSEVVIVWGRNITITNSHLIPFLKEKKLIVIDPVRTQIAKKADLFLQITPGTDYYVALMLSHVIFLKKSENKAWLDRFGPQYKDFYDLIKAHSIEDMLQSIDADIDDIERIHDYLYDTKTVFLVGAGVQKYSTGSYTLQAIDSLAALLGLFGREGCGVSYLGDSKLGFDNPFKSNCKRVSTVDTTFSDFDTVMVQGGNPAESMPDSNRVRDELGRVKNLIYFGLHENETSKMARIVIPAKSFLEKEDVRLSYGHQYVSPMKSVVQSEVGISEYDFIKAMLEALGLDGLESEEYYIHSWHAQCKELNGEMISPAYEAVPYSKGFGKDGDRNFKFIHAKHFVEQSKNRLEDGTLWLVSPKSQGTINTQFKRDSHIVLNPLLGYKDGEKIKASSEYGEYIFEVQCSEDLRDDIVLITGNTLGVNFLTSPIKSDKGESACYQEVKISIERV